MLHVFLERHGAVGLQRPPLLQSAAGQIDIGNAATNMTARMQKGVKQPNGEMMVEATMDVQNVANAVLFMDSVTPEANVPFLTVKASLMPWEGRG